MRVQALKSPVVHFGDKLEEVLTAILPKKMAEKSVVVVTSKVVSLCERRAVKIPEDERAAKALEEKLVRQESERYCLGSQRYDVLLGVRDGLMAARAGIDRLNTDGYFVLWPDDLQASANRIWNFLREFYRLEEVGVIISDSHVQMGRWGVFGMALAHCGFVALETKVGEKDLFDQKFAMTHIAVSEALAVAAVYEMGETNEQTPVAIIEDLPKVQFQKRPPTDVELREMLIEPEADLFADFLSGPEWKKGDRKHKFVGQISEI